MFKKLLAFLLICLLTLPCGIALAEETLTYGDYEYTLSDDGNATIVKYNGEEEDLTIPAELDGHPLTAIGDKAFYDCDFLTSLTLPDSVTAIGAEAFSYCAFLTSVTLPDSVTAIGAEAFTDCDALTSVTLPDSVTSLGANPFASCNRLTQITVSPDHPTLETIDGVLFEKSGKTLVCYPQTLTAESYKVPQGIQAIGDRAFMSCGSLTSVTLPDSLTSIGDLAFLNCSSLTSITLPDSLTSLGTQAFYDCDSLTGITIPNGVTSIGSNPFVACDQLTQITVFPDHPTLGTISGVLYDKTNNALVCYPCAFTAESYAIPQGIESINTFAFFRCNTLTSVTLPDSVTSLGLAAFTDCDFLTSISIPDSVSSIPGQAFFSCESLSLTVPEGSYAESFAVENNIPYTY